MSLTPEIAASFVAWFSTAEYGSAPSTPPKVPRPAYVLIPPATATNQGLRTFLFDRLAPRDMAFTDRGICVDERPLRVLLLEATAFTTRNAETASADGSASSSDASVMTANRRDGVKRRHATMKPRPGFSPWAVCDAASAEALLQGLPAGPSERRRLLEAFSARSNRQLPITTSLHVKALESLHNEFPNFSEVIDDLSDHLSLRARMKSPLQLPTTLVVGEPGVGKTEFCRRLASRLGFYLVDRSLAEMSAAFVLLGNSAAWSQSQPGLVAKMVGEMRDGLAPLLMLDELDKCRGDSQYPVDAALLGLMEPHTARAFRDEHLTLGLNLEPMSFLLTANRLDKIRPEILSRVSIATVRPPTSPEMRQIVRSVDNILRSELRGLDSAFERLSEEVMDHLAAMSPRALRSVLKRAYGSVARRNQATPHRLNLSVADFPEVARKPAPTAHTRSTSRSIVPLYVDDARLWARRH